MKVRVIDDLPPEDVAMLQALYSRSGASVDGHLEKVKRAGSGKFMHSFYVNFNHKSIADAGSTTIFVEGVSFLAAKALQSSPLYSGQETSSRYVDFAASGASDPLGNQGRLLARWFDFYAGAEARTLAYVRSCNPRCTGEDETRYEKTVAARTFDILRGFLPAGSRTQLSWHTNLRQLGDHLSWLNVHPLNEVRKIAATIGELAAQKYQATSTLTAAVSGVTDKAKERLEWMQKAAMTTFYSASSNASPQEPVLKTDIVSIPELAKSRPRGAVLPHWMNDLGSIATAFPLDYGSFRDLHRHRNGVIRMPMLAQSMGFYPWYLQQLDSKTHLEAVNLIDEQAKEVDALDCPPEVKQYYIPLGYTVPCEVTMGLPAFLYLLELRSQKTVHSTLRQQILKLVRQFKKLFPMVALHADEERSDWDIRRGGQTIEERA